MAADVRGTKTTVPDLLSMSSNLRTYGTLRRPPLCPPKCTLDQGRSLARATLWWRRATASLSLAGPAHRDNRDGVGAIRERQQATPCLLLPPQKAGATTAATTR
jgi:hypothetical protein